MIWRFFVLLFFVKSLVFGQKRVLLYSNSSPEEGIRNTLVQKSRSFGINLVYSSSLDSVSNYEAIFFLDFDDEKLSVKENAVLLAFFKNGGGVIGSQNIFRSKITKLWYEQMFGVLQEDTAKRLELDLIPVRNLGGIELSPLWRLSNVSIVSPKVPKYLKPVLITLDANAVAWTGTSEFGNKIYLTSVKLESKSLENDEFFKAIMGGVNTVLSERQIQKVETVTVPAISDFRMQNLASGFQNARAFEYFSKDFCVILNGNGEVLNYKFASKELVSLGVFEKLQDATDITFDPEFELNGYAYFYSVGEKAKVQRIKLLSSSKAETDDFLAESSLPTKNVIISKNDTSNIGMPKYYQGKRFDFDLKDVLWVSTLNAEGQVIDREPFVLDFSKDSLQAIAQKENGELLVLTAGSLKLAQLKNKESFPPFVSFTFKNLSSKPPFKVQLEAVVEDGFDLEWEVSGKKFSGKKVTYAFKTLGEYPVKLRAFNQNGQSDNIFRTIKIEKALIVK